MGLEPSRKLNAIDDDVPGLLQDAVLVAEHDPNIHIVLSGKGKGFCGGYDPENKLCILDTEVYAWRWCQAGGGSDIALCSWPAGYMSSGDAAMWVYRVGAERAKRILFTGDQIPLGLVN